MAAGPEQELSALRSPRENNLYRTDTAIPTSSKFFGELFLSRQNVRHCEVVFTKDSPNPSSCQQVARIVYRTEHFSECAEKHRLLLTCPASNPAIDGSILVMVCVDTELSGIAIDGSLVFQGL